MNKIARLVTYPLFFMPLLFTPASLLAQTPFDGTWLLIDLYKDNPYVTSDGAWIVTVNKGIFVCLSCRPRIEVKADGTDQAIAGHSFDVFNVREVDAKTIATIDKKGGKTVSESVWTVSDDGKTVIHKRIGYPENGDTDGSYEVSFTRVENGPAGGHAFSGSWRGTKAQKVPTFTYKSSGDELSWEGFGESFTAKFDGKDYPVKGAVKGETGESSVSLKRLDESTIEETDKVDGKVTSISKMTVSPDGKKMTTVGTSTKTGKTYTNVAEKQ
jgi:hypothetical protein